MSLSPNQVRLAATNIPWTKDFRHMKPFPRFWLKRMSFLEPNVKAARPKDRIKYWNIVPGDRVRVIGDEEGRILEVSSINRITNRVYLKGTGEIVRACRPKGAGTLNVHYSKCQLFIGNHEFPPKANTSEPRVVPYVIPSYLSYDVSSPLSVFATRLGTSSPHWLPIGHRYEWDRFAAATTPRLPNYSKDTPKVRIPWPKPTKPTPKDVSLYATTEEAVTVITYKPFSLPASINEPIPELPAENTYIQSLFNPKARPYDAAAPVEVYLQKELSNPHGRAKKQARWQAAQAHKRELLDMYVRKELGDLKGRTRREARAEAVWKWQKRLADDLHAEKKQRWINRGQEAKMERKKVRRARKVRKQTERLEKLVLEEARNQVIPP
ncbi:hypothetical protein BV25DRAFT_1791294 [Artomyces pyxidatus]|uniref:Uncharacterized protein n=1 Tax=Artomyces pyxidatus TaxID=48021 RepID=A0ACB8TKQ1_9AGAM|nr:hypothetical protein BV25DRAFT_1791294 [Artomyces pyxidatus]